MPAPFFTIRADGVDVTGNLTGAGLMSMTITDAAGLNADSLQIDTDDVDGTVVAPRRGAVLNPIAGYDDGRVRDFGLFIVDSVTFAGWPQSISISAKSVDAMSLAKQREPRAFTAEKFPTYGDIFEDIAGRARLGTRIAPAIASERNRYEAQTDEDALEFIARIADKLGAAVTTKAGNIVAVLQGAGQNASGQALDRVRVAAGENLISYTVTLQDDPKYSEVEATYYDRAKNERRVASASTGMEGPKFLMRFPFQDERDAQRAAEARSNGLQRMQGDAQFTIDGDPFAQAEAWALVSGARPGVDGLWRITSATHNFSSTGPYTTSLSCETPSGETGGQSVEGTSGTYAGTAPTSTGRAAGPV